MKPWPRGADLVGVRTDMDLHDTHVPKPHHLWVQPLKQLRQSMGKYQLVSRAAAAAAVSCTGATITRCYSPQKKR
jgi:hypothetical protein